MNTNRFPVLGLLVLALFLPARSAPQTQPQTKPQTKPETDAQTPPAATKTAFPVFSYDQENRRDPFKDLFGGKELRERRVVTGFSDLEIAEVVIMGIVKVRGHYEAIAAFSDGFPITVREGQLLADGVVQTIEADRIIFRKTSEKGFPLAKPREIIKEITPEERAHD